MAKRNLKSEVCALKAKGRVAEAERRQAEGPKSPWHANTDAPLREVSLQLTSRGLVAQGLKSGIKARLKTIANMR